MHFGISEGIGGVKIWKPSVGGYGYFLESPINIKTACIIKFKGSSLLRYYLEIIHALHASVAFKTQQQIPPRFCKEIKNFGKKTHDLEKHLFQPSTYSSTCSVHRQCWQDR